MSHESTRCGKSELWWQCKRLDDCTTRLMNAFRTYNFYLFKLFKNLIYWLNVKVRTATDANDENHTCLSGPITADAYELDAWTQWPQLRPMQTMTFEDVFLFDFKLKLYLWLWRLLTCKKKPYLQKAHMTRYTLLEHMLNNNIYLNNIYFSRFRFEKLSGNFTDNSNFIKRFCIEPPTLDFKIVS